MGRRCFSDKIVESDAFYQLPTNAQALYFHLGMAPDDDGFINRASSIASKMKGGKTALKKLVESRFLLQFGDIYVIKHWRMSNSLKNDRLKPLSYASIAQKIWVKPNKAYTDHPVPGCQTLYEEKTGIQLESNGNPVGIPTEPNLTQPNLTQPNTTEPKALDGLFQMLLENYPEGCAGNTVAASDAFKQVIQNQEAANLAIRNLELWKQSEQWCKDGGKYIPYLSNWILRGTWRTKPDKMAVPQGASGELGEAELEAIRRVLRDDSLEGQH